MGSSTESSPTQSTGAQQLPEGTATAAMDIDGEAWRDAKMGPASGPAAARGSQEMHRPMRERPEEGKRARLSAISCPGIPVQSSDTLPLLSAWLL